MYDRQVEDVSSEAAWRLTDPATGVSVARKVTALHLNHDHDLIDLKVRTPTGTAVLHTTAHHPFYDATLKEWVPAAELIPGHRLDTLTAGQVGRSVERGGVLRRGQRLKRAAVAVAAGSVLALAGPAIAATPAVAAPGPARVVDSAVSVGTISPKTNTTGAARYDLTVDITHTYYVLAGTAAVLVHNTNECDSVANSKPDDLPFEQMVADFNNVSKITAGTPEFSQRPRRAVGTCGR